jgi:hypothetical protein
MTYPIIRRIAAVSAFLLIVSSSVAQDSGPKSKSSSAIQEITGKPFRILSNGQRITVQSDKDITRIIVWTASGNRFVEQSNIEVPSYNFTIPTKEKYVFMMLELKGAGRYTEKIGVR